MVMRRAGCRNPNRLAPLATHFAPKAKYLIQLFMPGGPSQVDTFDHKPLLAKHAGQRPQLVNRKSLRNTKGGLFPSPFGFRQYGETGKWVSDLFPHVGQHVDELVQGVRDSGTGVHEEWSGWLAHRHPANGLLFTFEAPCHYARKI